MLDGFLARENKQLIPSMRSFANEYGAALRKLRPVPAGSFQTVLVYPPFSVRQFDWHAYRDAHGLVGMGATEQDAIADLLEREANVSGGAC